MMTFEGFWKDTLRPFPVLLVIVVHNGSSIGDLEADVNTSCSNLASKRISRHQRIKTVVKLTKN